MKLIPDEKILSYLALDEEYGRKILPFLKEEYFQNKEDQVLFGLISSYVDGYNAFPTKEALFIDLDKQDLNEAQLESVRSKIEGLAIDENTNKQWLLDQTEEFCQWQAIKNALFQSVKIIDGKESKLDKGSIPDILQKALAVGFDTNIGHDYLEDWEKRYDYIHRTQKRIPFDLEYFNKITRGGFADKTLNVFLAGTHVGKTLCMCHMAASNLALGHNVVYITLEMGDIGDPSITQRIDANLLDVPLDELNILPKDSFGTKINRITKKTHGKLIVKEYPTASAGANHFRFLLNELKLKKDFVPDIVYIDYINLCISSRLRYGQNVGSYAYIKSVSEELRGLAQEFKIPIVTASQLNRAGYADSDPGLEHSAESFGTPMTADFTAIILSNEQLQDLNQYMVKQVKSRYDDIARCRRFIIGVDKTKMRLYDVDQEAQTNDVPIMDAKDFAPPTDVDTDIFKKWN